MDSTVIGLVGPIASGKGFVASHLKELGFVYESLSDRVREEVRLRGLDLSRKNLQDVGNDLREKFGGQILAERTALLILDINSPIVIDGIRNPGEIEFLKRTLGIKIIGITASDDRRLEWYLTRAKERGEDGATPEDFYRANLRDLGTGEGTNGQQVNRCLEMADFIIENEGNKSELLETCDTILKRYFQLDPEGRIHRSKEIK